MNTTASQLHMSEATVLARTRAFVNETFLYMRPGFALADTDRLLQRGVIDSMGVMELIAFLRSEFEVIVADEDITETNLGTLADIARYVSAHSNGNGAKPEAKRAG